MGHACILVSFAFSISNHKTDAEFFFRVRRSTQRPLEVFEGRELGSHEVKKKLFLMRCSSSFISLENGPNVVFSHRHSEALQMHKWSVGERYVYTYIDGKQVYMHSFIVHVLNKQERAAGYTIDHINRDTLDNRDENLRYVDWDTQNRNKDKRSNTTSIYRGVYWGKQSSKWMAQATNTETRKLVYLGGFDNEIDAALTYDRYVSHQMNATNVLINFEHRRAEFCSGPAPLPILRKKFVGIVRRGGKYRGVINLNGKSCYTSFYFDEELAAFERDKKIVELNLKGRRLNFPERFPDYDIREIFIEIVHEDDSTVKAKVGKNGKVVKVDRETFELFKFNMWSISNGYVCVQLGRKRCLLHRLVAEACSDEEVVKHINGDLMDCTKSNLEVRSRSMSHKRAREDI